MEEALGCISPRTKYRRMRLEIFKQTRYVSASTNIYPGFYHSYASPYPGGMVAPPQPVHIPIYLSAGPKLSDISSLAPHVVVGVQGTGCAYRSLISDSLLVPVSNRN